MKHIQKNKKELLVFSIILAGLIFLPQGKATINWIPPQTEENAYIGTSKVINAVFKSTKDLENVKFWLTPRLSKYVKVEPETIAKIEKDKEYNISIIVSIPTDFKTRKHEKDDFKNSFKSYLDQDFDEKEYKQDFKDQEEFFKDFNPDKIRGLLFVAEEKQTKWPDFIKQKRTVRRIYPLPLKIIINVKKATAQDTIESFEIESDPTKVVISEGVKFLVNEIIILLKDEAKLADAIEIAKLVDGVIDGFVPNPPTYKILVQANIPTQLYDMIAQIKNIGDSLLIEAVPNIISE